MGTHTQKGWDGGTRKSRETSQETERDQSQIERGEAKVAKKTQMERIAPRDTVQSQIQRWPQNRRGARMGKTREDRQGVISEGKPHSPGSL